MMPFFSVCYKRLQYAPWKWAKWFPLLSLQEEYMKKKKYLRKKRKKETVCNCIFDASAKQNHLQFVAIEDYYYYYYYLHDDAK